MAVRVSRTMVEQETVLQIDGQLRSADTEELAKECASVEGRLTLELSNLVSADSKGVELLLELVSLGAEVRNASPYVRLLMKAGV